MLTRVLFSPVMLLLAYFIIRFFSKGLLAIYYPEILRWHIPERSVLVALVWGVVFFGIFVISYFVASNIKFGFQLHATPKRSPKNARYLILLCIACVGIQYLSFLVILNAFGGLSGLLNSQAAVASHILEYNLGIYYGVMSLCIVPFHVLFCFKVNRHDMPIRRERFFGVVLLVLLCIPFVILSRRSVLLFALLPLVYYYHFNCKKIPVLKFIPLLGAVFVSFIFMSIFRMNFQASYGLGVFELLISPEFAIFDCLALVHSQLDYLRSYINISALVEHPELLSKYYLGSIIGSYLFDFSYFGGAIPPTIIGNAVLLYGDFGLVLYPVFLGVVLGVLYKFFRRGDSLSLLFFYLFFFYINIFSNGDIWLSIKIMLRYYFVLIPLLFIFFSFKVRRIGHGR